MLSEVGPSERYIYNVNVFNIILFFFLLFVCFSLCFVNGNVGQKLFDSYIKCQIRVRYNCYVHRECIDLCIYFFNEWVFHLRMKQ